MRKTMLALATLLATSTAAIAQDANFTLSNMTGYSIVEVYVSPSKQKNWGPDRLGNYTLEHGGWYKLSFPQDRSQCVQDMKVVFGDDKSEVTWEGFNLCEIDKIRLK